MNWFPLKLFSQVKLADKQAAVEKLQWETTTSNKKVESLQEDLDKVQGEISSFMLLIEGLTRNEFSISAGDYDYDPYPIDQNHEIVSQITIRRQLLHSLSKILNFCTNNYVLETKTPFVLNHKILISPNWQDHEMDIEELEAAREAYITAVAAAKELKDEESVSAAARARFRLQSLVLQQS